MICFQKSSILSRRFFNKINILCFNILTLYFKIDEQKVLQVQEFKVDDFPHQNQFKFCAKILCTKICLHPVLKISASKSVKFIEFVKSIIAIMIIVFVSELKSS